MVQVVGQTPDYREHDLRDPDDADTADAVSDADVEPEIRQAMVSSSLHGERLDRVLVAMAPEFSRSHLQHLLEGGHVQLDGKQAASSSRRVRFGQAVQLALVATEESLAFRPQPIALAVLYEDEHLLVIDKPAGLVVHPGAGNWSGTLLNGLLARDAAAARLPRAGIVHRLDKDTSGVMVVGRTLPAVTALSRAIGERQVHRRYLALAHGSPSEPSFSIEAPIGRDPQVRVRMAVVPGARASRTDVRRLAALDGMSARDRISALRCTLHTGRTHQIRVHLASIGHPLVADALYGGRPALGMQRQALHACQLRLDHPISGEPMDFEAAMPPDLHAAWVSVCGL